MWKDLLKQALTTKLNCRVLAGFNANVDVVIKLNAEMIESVIEREPQVLDNLCGANRDLSCCYKCGVYGSTQGMY